MKLDIPHFYPVEKINNVEIPVEKKEPYYVEKKIPFVIETRYPVFVDKEVQFDVPKPYPVYIPIYRHVYHHSGKH